VDQARDQGDHQQHQHAEPVDQGADVDLEATGLEPRDLADDRQHLVVLLALLGVLLLGGGTLALGGVLVLGTLGGRALLGVLGLLAVADGLGVLGGGEGVGDLVVGVDAVGAVGGVGLVGAVLALLGGGGADLALGEGVLLLGAVVRRRRVVDPLDPADAGGDGQHEADGDGGDADLGAAPGQLLAHGQDGHERDRHDQRDDEGVGQHRSASHQVELVEVDASAVAVDGQDDRQTDADLGGGHGDDEQGEHLARDVAVHGREGDQVDVHGVEDQLDRHQHGHAVPTGDHAVDADGEQEGAEQEELVEQHGQSLRAITMAPMRAAVSSTEMTSNWTR
jgi:hypothetical protein